MTSFESVGDGYNDVIEDEVVEEIATPEKTNDNKIEIGMVFKTIDEAHDRYKEYGGSKGFSIRKRTTYKSGTEIIGVVFTCCCGGTFKPTDKTDDNDKIKRSSSTMKTGCSARMRIRWIQKTKLWKTSIFQDVHNHSLVTPSKCILMKSNIRMPAAAKSLSKSFRRENMQLSKVPGLFGGANIGFDKRDVWNHMRNVRSLFFEEGDVEGVRNYFEKMSSENPHFYYAIQCDDEGRATNFFWVDARSRMAYNRFGDAITFDTTCRTNKYNMPFAPFIGVNHHGQSILLGCALLENEVEDTFIWLFETWLKAMGGRPPLSIITDQDLAMGAAIKKVFPNTRHRLCLWHIKKKFAEKLSHVFFKKSKFKQALKRCTRGATIEDFEEQWESLLREYCLQDNEWL